RDFHVTGVQTCALPICRLESAEADLARLEDLVNEVDAKVRSLARQRRRAQRYTELRSRRLVLEVTVAAAELRHVRETLELTARRSGGRRVGDGGEGGVA